MRSSDVTDDGLAFVSPRAHHPAVGLNSEADHESDPQTALGLLVWRHRLFDGIRRDTAHISPMTAGGSLRVVAWFLGVAAIALFGRLVAPGLGRWWIAIAFAVMFAVAARRDRRSESPD